MTDRGPYGDDPDPTEVFPPLRDDPTRTPPSGLPPIGADRDPEPTRVLPPTQSDVPTTSMPAGGGPYQPGPAFGGAPGGGGGGGNEPPYEPPYEPEPDPWYRQPGPLAALIAGIAAVIVGIIALVVWTGGDDDGGLSGETLPSVASTSTTTTAPTTTVAPGTTLAPETTAPTTVASTTTTTTTTIAPTTTTTTIVPETTTTTTAPATTTTTPTTEPPPPAGQALLDEIRANPVLSTFSAALGCTGLDQDVLDGVARTVLAPTNDAFAAAGLTDPCADVTATEPILLLHVVSVDLDAQAVFGADQLQTLGGRVDVNRASQEIGANAAQITNSVHAGNGWVHTIDEIVT